MTRKTINELIAQADSTLEDNTSGLISASDVRSMVRDVIDTFKPGLGAVGTDSVTLPLLGLTPVDIPYTTMFAVTGEFIATLAAGTVQRLAQGLPTVNNRITFAADVSAQDGSEITISLYRDGVDVPGGTTVTARGVGNLVGVSFQIINATPEAGDPVYVMKASKITGAAADVTLTNVRFILEVVPTLGI